MYVTEIPVVVDATILVVNRNARQIVFPLIIKREIKKTFFFISHNHE